MSSALVSLVAVVLLAAGCGGGDERASEATLPPVIETSTTELVTTTAAAETTTSALATTAPATASAASPTIAADMTAKAIAAVLQPGDFPAGFAPTPATDGGGLQIEALWSQLVSCLGLEPTKTNGIATSPTFLRGLATQARATVDYTTTASTDKIAAAIAGPRFKGCATDAFATEVKRSAPEGAVPGPVEVAFIKAHPVAPRIAAYRIDVTLKLDELTVPIVQDFFIIFHGGAVIRAQFLNTGGEFPQDLERSLLEKVVSRT